MKAKPMLYTLSTCVHCKALKHFLRENGVEYDYIDVDKLTGSEKQDIISKVNKISGGTRFPTIVIGKKVIVGFYEEKVREALGL